MVGGVAVCSTANPAAIFNYAIETTGSSGLSAANIHGKCTYSPSQLHNKCLAFRNHLVLFKDLRRNLAPRTITFSAIPDEKGNSETWVSHHFIDDSELTNPADNESSLDHGEKTFASLFLPNTGVLGNVGHPVDQKTLFGKLKAVTLHVLAMEQWNSSRLKMCHRNYLVSATNLIHYLALKSVDMKHLHEELSSAGPLSLENINPYVLSSLSACIQLLNDSSVSSLHGTESSGEPLPICGSLSSLMKEDFSRTTMVKKAGANRDVLLGRLQGGRMTHIMVTVGSEVVENDMLVTNLINAGTTVFRINCAHGNPGIWNEIIQKVKRTCGILEKPCQILMDLAGPKLRTGRLKDGPCVVKVSPKRNAIGRVLHPAHVWLSSRGAGPPPPHVSPDAVLHVDGQKFLSKLEVDDSVKFTDARGKLRTLRILSKHSVFSGVGFVAECSKTAYVESGTKFHIEGKKRGSSVAFVVDVPRSEQFVRLRVGDLLLLSRDGSDEQNESISSAGAHRITCPSGYLFDSVKPGDPIAFDDGKIRGVVKGSSMSEVIVSITHAGLKGTKLGSEKSINIPESNIQYEGLTSKDLMDLDFVAAHADMVGISFVRDVCDIIALRQELEKRKIRSLGVVLKIETRGGFEKLPLLLLEAMKCPNPLGVMIARGDLAVECGWEKLTDIQEEIISICDAAHVPVIWATQVLESLIKSGVPTRAEITDAAHGRRVSCIMLNKGKHIVEAVSTLEIMLNSRHKKMETKLSPLLFSSSVY